MTQSVIKKVEDMAIKEDCDEDLIFSERNWSNLEVYNNDVNTHDVTTAVDNSYNNNNNNDAVYEDDANDKEYGTTYEYGYYVSATHEYITNYTPTPNTDNTP